MGSSAKKKKEKKADFQKPKLKVGKARPKNTNATDTSFSAKSIILRQQNLSESGRDAAALFNHNLSLLSSRNETQRRDALQYLTTACVAAGKDDLPQSPSTVIAKAQSLVLDGNSAVRVQLLKLLNALSSRDIGPVDQLVVYIRAGLTHLSVDIRLSTLDVFDWLLRVKGEAVLTTPGAWVKILRTFQNLLSWHGKPALNATALSGNWTTTRTTSSNPSGNKLLVHQISSLTTYLASGLSPPAVHLHADSVRSAKAFPLYTIDAQLLPTKSNAFGYLNLFGAVRDLESESYEDVDDRRQVFVELGFWDAFRRGAMEARKEAGEVGRAVGGLLKLLKAAEVG